MGGAYRNSSLIPHDNDIDLWVEKAGFKALKDHFHTYFPKELFLHAEKQFDKPKNHNHMAIRDLHSCRKPSLTGTGSIPSSNYHPFWNFHLDLYTNGTSMNIVEKKLSGTGPGPHLTFPVFNYTEDQLAETFGGQDWNIAKPLPLKSMDSDFTPYGSCPVLKKYVENAKSKRKGQSKTTASFCGISVDTNNTSTQPQDRNPNLGLYRSQDYAKLSIPCKESFKQEVDPKKVTNDLPLDWDDVWPDNLPFEASDLETEVP